MPLGDVNETRSIPPPPMPPAIWGTPDEAIELSPGVRDMLAQVLGVTPTRIAPVTAVPSASRLTDQDLDRLRGIVGEAEVSTAPDQRLRRSAGKSTPDLLRSRRDADVSCPDAAVAPSTDDEVAGLLRWCTEAGVAVVPFGGGTSVVGGLHPETGPHRAVIALDLARFDRLEALDPVSHTAVLGAGLTGPAAEELLRAEGFTLGHYPQSFLYATIGGFAMTRSSGQASAGYGRFDEMVEGLTVITPAGTLECGHTPASAAGPDLRELVLGSEGAFGVCTRVRVRVRPLTEANGHEAFSLPDFATGVEAVRAAVQAGARPTVLRLSDEAETAVSLAVTSDIGSSDPVAGCLCVTTVDGAADDVPRRQEEIRRILLDHGATSLGPGPAEGWERGRFGAPVLRDALLDVGVLCETLETAGPWSRLGEIRGAVTGALETALAHEGSSPLVLCHVSHVYETGASLYFTVVAAQDPDDPVAHWLRAKESATRAVLAAGGTLTHHHAVGRDHAGHLRDEIGDLGVEVLRAVKRTVDPTGIMNPGTLIP